jgi:pimeloyl-ACP methyl ester carboxylesterase
VLIAPLAPIASQVSAEYERRFLTPLQPVLEHAEKLVAEKHGLQLMKDVSFLTCDHARVTAAAFVNYYGSNQNLYTPSLMPFLKMPVLVMVGELDPLATELKPAIEGIPDARNVTMETIPGADRYFRDLAAEEVANRIRDFLKKPSTSKRVDNSTTDRP